MEAVNFVNMKKMNGMKINLFVCFVILFLGSCCKQYSCSCYDQNAVLDQVRTAKTKKERAEEWCSVLDKQQNKAVEGYCVLQRVD
jgi:hypothetical protein